MQGKNLLDIGLSAEIPDIETRGLTSSMAEQRLARYGKNILASEKKAVPLKIFLGQFRDIMVMILLAAAGVSAFLGETADAVTIVIIVAVNALLGFIQEYRTEKTLAALRGMTAPTAKVWRDGHMIGLPAAELVPDDVISLEAGDKVPADGVILRAENLLADESILTGESSAVFKSCGDTSDGENRIGRTDFVYSGTLITSGSAEVKITATGKNAQVGKISGMLTDISEEETPLQKRLGELGKTVAVICIVVCALVAGAGIIRGEPPFDMFMTGITIAIAAIPEGLPATVTIALALAVRRMLKLNALVHKLHSVETLGCTSVICTDKTGTVTENKMTVTEMYADGNEYAVSGTGYKIKGEVTLNGRKVSCFVKEDPCLALMMKNMVLCGNSDIYINDHSDTEWKTTGDPTECALLSAAAKYGLDIPVLRKENPRKEEIPFSSETRSMSVVCTDGGGKNIRYSKGACDVILKNSAHAYYNGRIVPLGNTLRKELSDRCDAMSDKALRVIAFSCSDENGRDIFLGMAGMLDPPRPEAKKAVKSCREAHIKTVMITGDHKKTAAAIAEAAGIMHSGDIAVSGAELSAMSEAELDEKLPKITVCARVTPADKLRIVRAFKRAGNIVTMTGDGVNDAPAVKEADIGVAMGITGTDVTREAADMVLLDDNFATIVNAVEQGRGIYANIRKFVRYLLSCNIGEVLTMFLGILMGMPMVLLPAQILLVNLVTDGLPAVALGVEPVDKNCMKEFPRRKDESFFAGGLITKIIFRGALIGLCTLGCFTVLINMGADIPAARTGALMTLVMSQLLHVFECKSEKKNIFTVPYFNNPGLIGAVAVSAAAVFAAVYFPPLAKVFSTVPLTQEQLMVSLGAAAAAPLLQCFSPLLESRSRTEKIHPVGATGIGKQ